MPAYVTVSAPKALPDRVGLPPLPGPIDAVRLKEELDDADGLFLSIQSATSKALEDARFTESICLPLPPLAK
jgi:hypothetical protein